MRRTGSGPGRPRRGSTARSRVAALRRPRLTGRAAVLALVVAALVVSYASSLRAYLEQRDHISSLRGSIAASEAAIAGLQREERRWDDPAYVVQQARARFAYGFPGEIGYQVLDVDGRPLDHQDSLPDPAALEEPEPTWWQAAIASVEAAGHPRDRTPPATRLAVGSASTAR